MSSVNPDPEFTRAPPLPADFFEGEEEEPVSIFAVANLFVRHARIVFGLPLVAFVIVAAITMFQAVEFSATSRFMTTQSEQFRQRGGSGLLDQLGQLMNTSAGTSPQFYAALVTSGAIVREAARDTYGITVEGEIRRGTFAELVEGEPMNPDASLRASERLIRRNLAAEDERGTGFVAVSMKSPWPELSVQVNRRILEVVNDFNMAQRQSQAAMEREFVEARLQEMDEALRGAERELQTFLEANQQYDGSPRLRFEAQRLERQVAFRQGLYSSLAQAYEQARLTEVRNTPLIEVVEWPDENLSSQSGQTPLFNGFLAAIVTMLVMAGLVLVRAYLHRHSEEHSDDYEEFRELIRTGLASRAPERVRDWVGMKALPSGGKDSGRNGPPSDEPDKDGAEPARTEELDPATRP